MTKNEILTSPSAADQYWLAIVAVDGGRVFAPAYQDAPFRAEPGFGATSVNYVIRALVAGIEHPRMST